MYIYVLIALGMIAQHFRIIHNHYYYAKCVCVCVRTMAMHICNENHSMALQKFRSFWLLSFVFLAYHMCEKSFENACISS